MAATLLPLSAAAFLTVAGEATTSLATAFKPVKLIKGTCGGGVVADAHNSQPSTSGVATAK